MIAPLNIATGPAKDVSGESPPIQEQDNLLPFRKPLLNGLFGGMSKKSCDCPSLTPHAYPQSRQVASQYSIRGKEVARGYTPPAVHDKNSPTMVSRCRESTDSRPTQTFLPQRLVRDRMDARRPACMTFHVLHQLQSIRGLEIGAKIADLGPTTMSAAPPLICCH